MAMHVLSMAWSTPWIAAEWLVFCALDWPLHPVARGAGGALACRNGFTDRRSYPRAMPPTSTYAVRGSFPAAAVRYASVDPRVLGP